jgi:hypothetical protein
VPGVCPAAKWIAVTTPLALVELLVLVELFAEPPEPELPLELDVERLLDEVRLLPPLVVRVALGLGVGVWLGFGVGVTVKLAALVAVPPGVVTLSGPLVAPAGTVAVICVSLLAANCAARPLKATTLAPVKPLPTRVTLPPAGPEVGISAVMAGTATSVSLTLPAGLEPFLVTALTVVMALRRLTALAVVAAAPVALELVDELPVPPSEIVTASRAPASVKSACTVSAIVPVVAVEVR